MAFYRDVAQFGVQVVQDKAAFLTTGSAPLAIYRSGEDPDIDASGHGFFMNVAAEDLEELRGRLEAFGIAPIREWEEGTEIHLLVVDPDGNRVEFECPSK